MSGKDIAAPQPEPKKKKARKPTSKMIKTAAIMLENGGVVSSAMSQAGYSPAMAKNPQKLTRSESFAALLDDIGVTDSRLGEVLKDGLNATKTVVIGQGEDAFADQVEDHAVRHRYLETGLRLKGLGKSEGNTIQFTTVIGTERSTFDL